MVFAPSPAAVGSPMTPAYAPAIAGLSGWPNPNGGSLPVMSQPCASSVSLLMNCTLTCAPWGTMIAGLVSPAMVKVMSGPPGAMATTVKDALVVWKVIVSVRGSMLAPAGAWALSALTWLRGTFCGAFPASPVPAFCATNCASDGSSKVLPLPGAAGGEEGIVAEGSIGAVGVEGAAGEASPAPRDGETVWPVYPFAAGWYWLA